MQINQQLPTHGKQENVEANPQYRDEASSKQIISVGITKSNI